MKSSAKILISFATLLVVTVLCRFAITFPKTIQGFTPVYALMVFSGIIFRKDKKYAFALPLICVFISDIIYQMLYNAGRPFNGNWGFYEYQLLNYALYAITTCVGFFVKKINVINVVIASVAAPTLFYILSNFSVWITTDFYPKSLAGLVDCYVKGLPFYLPWSLIATVIYSGVLFGIFYGTQNATVKKTAVSH